MPVFPRNARVSAITPRWTVAVLHDPVASARVNRVADDAQRVRALLASAGSVSSGPRECGEVVEDRHGDDEHRTIAQCSAHLDDWIVNRIQSLHRSAPAVLFRIIAG